MFVFSMIVLNVCFYSLLVSEYSGTRSSMSILGLSKKGFYSLLVSEYSGTRPSAPRCSFLACRFYSLLVSEYSGTGDRR